MKDDKNHRLKIIISLFFTVLAIVTLSCKCDFDIPTAAEVTATYMADPHAGVSDSGGASTTEPEGVSLDIDEGALLDGSRATVKELPPDDLPWGDTPFEPAEKQYEVDLGGDNQRGRIIMIVPEPDKSDPTRRFVYAAWVQPEAGEPSLVGAREQDGKVTFPIVGAGKYQLIRIPNFEDIAKLYIDREPLSVPTYRQMTPAWCSPTALTDLAGYYQGSWPIGGYGSVWGESSNWYLAGVAGQPFDKGYFFHWLLAAAGYSTPSDVKQSFVNGNAMVIIWNWRSYQITEGMVESDLYYYSDWYITTMTEYAEELYQAFRSYVEASLWGGKQPVAWGSSLAGHSRIITGSDGTNIYFNNPSSGSWNNTKSWEVYHQEIMDSLYAEKTEVIDTTVFFAEARPAEQRRAVLWLLPWTDNNVGSIVFRQGSEKTLASYWIWDGENDHDYGYYYNDLTGNLPTTAYIETAFKATSYNDVVEFGYSVKSISDGTYDYSVLPELFNGVGQVDADLHGQAVLGVGSGQQVNSYPAGSIPIANLEPGMYRLKFTLFQGNYVEDVKYVFFMVAEHGPLPIPSLKVREPAFCRKGPGSLYEVVTGFEPGQELKLVGFNQERTWGKFEATMNAITFQCWVSLDLMDIPDGVEGDILETPPLPLPGPSLTATPTATFCSQFTTPQTCALHTECTWDRLVSPAVCKSK